VTAVASGIFILASYAFVAALAGPWGLLAAVVHLAVCAAAGPRGRLR
jgi:hypothetical protein